MSDSATSPASTTPSPYTLYHGDALDAYQSWDAPDLIISDGAYGVGGFPGDPKTPARLAEWYAPHVEAWGEHVKPSTTLWFWNTEVGWATVHPLLVANGWEYVQLVTWDKGIAHVAGNVNGNTIRQCPVVTEVSALYRRKPTVVLADGNVVTLQDWFRGEWKRAGLTQKQANEACGTKSAASRKYLTGDAQWYLPPKDMLDKMIAYANEHGRPEGRPYFSQDEMDSVSCTPKWEAVRGTWNHEHGITNVWSRNPLAGEERIRHDGKGKSLHLNQKPLDLMERQVRLASNEGDVVWEPFGGLASASVAAVRLGRWAFVAEPSESFAEIAERRLEEAVASVTSVAGGEPSA